MSFASSNLKVSSGVSPGPNLNQGVGFGSGTGGGGGPSGPLKEITQFTFPDGSKLVSPTVQVENMTCNAASTLTPGSGAQIKIATLDASTLAVATFGTYTFAIPSAANINQSAYVSFFDPGWGGDAYFWFNKDGGGSDPGVGFPGVEVAISTGDTFLTVGAAVVSALIANGWTDATGTPELTDLYVSVHFSCVGAGSQQFYDVIDINPIYNQYDSLTTGEDSSWLVIESYYFPFFIDGLGSNPPGSVDVFPCFVNSSDDATAVAIELNYQMTNNYNFWNATQSGNEVTFNNNFLGSGLPTDGDVPTNFTFSQLNPDVYSPNFTWFDGVANQGVWYVINGQGPPAGAATVEVDILSTDTAAQVATKTKDAMINSSISASTPSSTVVRWSYAQSVGTTPDTPVQQNLGFAFSVQTAPTNSPYWRFNDPLLGLYYVWYNFSSGGGPFNGLDPMVPGGTGIQNFGLNSASTANTIASSTRSSLIAALPAGFTVTIASNVLTLTNKNAGAVIDAQNVGAFSSGFIVVVTQQGSN